MQIYGKFQGFPLFFCAHEVWGWCHPLKVKWIWPESTQYTVLCLPAFTPELSGREVEDGTTVAKDMRDGIQGWNPGAKNNEVTKIFGFKEKG